MDKVAIVTGAASGMGAATAEKLVQKGFIVAGIDINSEKIEENAKTLLQEKGKLLAFKADVSKEEEIVEIFKKIEDLGPVHVLINCAGVLERTRLIDGDADLWRKTLEINVMGVSICTREAIKIMRKGDINGHIVHINSVAGHKIFPEVHGMYGASKHAITALTECLRLELNALGSKIKITSISPGATFTNIIRSETRKEKKIPFLNPEDIADAILYVLSTPEHVQGQRHHQHIYNKKNPEEKSKFLKILDSTWQSK